MIVVAENLTVAHPEVARAVARRDPEPLQRLARAAVEAGAAYLDVNLGRSATRDDVAFVVGSLEGVWAGGLVADAARPEPMAWLAERWEGPVVLNGYSADPGRDGIPELAARLGAELVVFCMGSGVPREADERLALAAELVGRCQEAGVPLQRIWIDPVLVPLGWQDGQAYNAALLEVLRRLPEVFGEPVATIVGLSNLTTGAAGGRGTGWLQGVFLAAAAGAGLTHVMLDATRPDLRRVVAALEVFENRRLYAPEEFRAPGPGGG
ncbi:MULTISPECIES: pterin-binding domain-containing protein [Deferrisoma]